MALTRQEQKARAGLVRVRDFVTDEQKPYRPYGEILSLFTAREKEILVEGPAGTGKSVGILSKLHLMAEKYAGMRGMIVRKTRASLTQSGLVTWETEVVPAGRLASFGRVKRGNRSSYLYPNGSEIVVGGMDDPTKIMSTQYDIIYPQEATEFTETEWEDMISRLRHYVVPYQQIVADCNPDDPRHWLNVRCNRGDTKRLITRHEDNPILYDHATGEWTEIGQDYVFSTLERLTGARKERLRFGRWAQAEGVVYEEYDEAIHVVNMAELVARGLMVKTLDGRCPYMPVRENVKDVWAAQDWGFTNPGVLGAFIEDHDGRIYLTAEVYATNRTIDWWRDQMVVMHGKYKFRTVQCDPAEPSYILQYLAAGVPAQKAVNAIAPGVSAVRSRLEKAKDGRPRLIFVRDSAVLPDATLIANRQPSSVMHEFASYVWPKDRAGRVVKETPAPGIDHGQDMLRYAVAFKDLTKRQWGAY